MDTFVTLKKPKKVLENPSIHDETIPPEARTRVEKLPVDPKVAQMLALLSKQEYEKASEIQRLRLRLLLWAIHEKVIDNLKRLFDITVSGITLLFVWPIMLLTAAIIKLDSPGPVIFKQERVGKWGQKFYCLKFRSMYTDAEERKQGLMDMNEADEIVFKIKDDPRVTRVGRVIRKLSIDEMPQLFNVIRGEMSIVGPRPPLPIEVANYEFDHLNRLNTIHGITGLQQVSGRSNLEFKRWVELDIQYIREQSLGKDIKIMLKTIPVVIIGKGAY
ncbi:MAG: sugar transferase [Anaerolineales bacterium]|nr:sugar transferase [Anaerolineales bacterium]